MEEIGKKLREKRESLNKSLKDLHEQTRIRLEHLELLEAGNFSFLPETYVKSFLRSYAEALDLDPEDILGGFSDSEDSVAAPTMPAGPEPTAAQQPESQVLRWTLGVGIATFLIVIGFAFAQYRSQIHVSPDERTQVSLTTDRTAAAADLQSADKNGSYPDSAYSVRVLMKGIKPVSVRFLAGGQRLSEYELSKEQNIIWIEDQTFEIVVPRPEGLKIRLGADEIEQITSTGGPVRIAFATTPDH